MIDCKNINTSGEDPSKVAEEYCMAIAIEIVTTAKDYDASEDVD